MRPGKPKVATPKHHVAPLVIIADDFPDASHMYAEYLRMFGVHVEEASDGNRVLELARQHLPHVIFMDLAMPELDGWETTRILKADAATSSVRVVALSGHTTHREMETAREAGCDGFIGKPCLPEDLLTELNRLLPAALRIADPTKLGHLRLRLAEASNARRACAVVN